MTKTFRTQRLARGWTQAELAEHCRDEGVAASDSNLSKIERDVTAPSPALRAALCRLLELPITYFDREQRETRRKETP